MLAWPKAPYWEGLSRLTRGPHSAKQTQAHIVSACFKGPCSLLCSTLQGGEGIGWSEMASCKKPAFIPHYQTPLSINLSKFSFTTNYRCQLEGLFSTSQGWKPGIFFFLGQFNQRLFLLSFFLISIKSFWLKMTIFKENAGIPMKWMVWFIWNEMTSSKSQSWFYVALYKGKKTLPAGFSWEM